MEKCVILVRACCSTLMSCKYLKLRKFASGARDFDAQMNLWRKNETCRVSDSISYFLVVSCSCSSPSSKARRWAKSVIPTYSKFTLSSHRSLLHLYMYAEKLQGVSRLSKLLLLCFLSNEVVTTAVVCLMSFMIKKLKPQFTIDKNWSSLSQLHKNGSTPRKLWVPTMVQSSVLHYTN